MTDSHSVDDFHERLEGLAKAATPGPWQNGIEDLEGVVAPFNPGLGNVVCIPPTDEMYSSYEQWPANAAYIAALHPATALRLISELRALREALIKLSDAVHPLVATPRIVGPITQGVRDALIAARTALTQGAAS